MAKDYTTLGQVLGAPKLEMQGIINPTMKRNKKLGMDNSLLNSQLQPWLDYYAPNYPKYQESTGPVNPDVSYFGPGHQYLTELPGATGTRGANGAPPIGAIPRAAPGDENSIYAQWAKDYLMNQQKQSQLNMNNTELDNSYFYNIPTISGLNSKTNDLYAKAYLTQYNPDLQSIFNSTLAGKNYAKKNNIDISGNTLLDELTSLAGNGYNVGTKSGKTLAQIKRMVPDLARFGVNSLNDLVGYSIKNPFTGKSDDLFYNKTTGTLLPREFGSSMKGEGGSTYSLVNVNGKVLPMANWMDTSEAADYMPLAMMAGMALGPALGPLAGSLGSSMGLASGSLGQMALTAGIQGLGQGALGALTGGDFGKSFLTGMLGSGIGQGVAALNPGGSIANALAPLGNTASEAGLNAMLSSGINKALSGGLGALSGSLINGGSSQAGVNGALMGGLSGLVSGGLSSYGGIDPTLSNSLGGLAGKLLGSSLTPTGGSQGGTTPPKAGGSTGAGAIGGAIPPNILAQIKELQQKLAGQGASTQGLDNLAGWGKQKLGWT